MSHKDMAGCGRYSQGQLLLFAYGEREDREVEEHVKRCAYCREYLAGVNEVRSAARRAGTAEPGELTIRELRQKALEELAKRGSFSGVRMGIFRRLYRGSGPVLWWALAVVVVLLVLSVYFVARFQPYSGEAGKDIPAWVSGIGNELASLEGSFDEIEIEQEPIDTIFTQQETIFDIELAMFELEQEMGIYQGDGERDDYPADEFNGPQETYERELIPLLPDTEGGRST